MKLLREPLLHFALLGAGLFALYTWVRGDDREAPDEIVVSAGRIESLAAGFEAIWQRRPSDDELAGLVDDFVTEEVLYREALALGFERDDTVVRNRLRQKVEFFADSLFAERDPTDAELEAELTAHAERYRSEPRVTFEQVYLSPDRRGARLEADVQRVLADLRARGSGAPPSAAGDPISLPASFRELERRELVRLFGEEFAARIVTLEPGEWAGPIESGYGVHLVRVESRSEGEPPALAVVRAEVEQEWRNSRRLEARAEFVAKLRARYEVRVEAAK